MPSKTLKLSVLLSLCATILLACAGCSDKSKNARAMARGDKHFAEGAYEKARIEYLNVLKRDPQNGPAASRIGTIYFERGQIRSAFPFLAAAQKLDPDNLDAAMYLGSTFLAASELKKAREQALLILEKQPAHEEATLLLGESSRETSEIADAWKRLEQLEKTVGPKPAIFLARNSLYQKQNDTKSGEKAIIQAYALNTNSPIAMVAMGTLHWAKGELKDAERLFTSAASLSPIRSTRRLRLVDFKVQTGAVADAQKVLREINEKVSDHLPALVYQAKIDFSNRKFDTCVQLCQKVLAYDNSNYEALLLRARVKLAEEKQADALKDFERLRSLYPGTAEPRYYTGVINLAMSEVDKAIVNLSQATTLDTNFVPAALLLSELHVRQGDASSAIQLLTPIIHRQPKLVQPYLLLAAAYRAQDRLDEVRAVYQKMTALFPNEADPHFLMGLTLRQQGKSREARKSFLRAQEMNPKHVQSLNQLIDLDVSEKNYSAAWKRIEADISANPKSPDLHFLAAKLHVAQNDPTKAENELSKVLELDSAYQPAYAALAQLYVDSQKHEMALQQLKAGVEKNPKDIVSLMKIGMIYEQVKDYTLAAQNYEKLLIQSPKFAPALNNLAYIYTERVPQLTKAYQLAQKAREISPHDPFTADTLGWVLFKRGEYAWALKLILECADRMPNHPDVLYHLGMAYYMMGVENSARTALAKAVASEKKFESRVDAEARLAVLNLDMSKPANQLIEELNIIVEKSPTDFIAWLRLGGVYEKMREGEKARSIYEKALQINGKSVTAMMTLARLNAEQLNNQPRAMALAKEARNLAPDNPNIVEMLGPLAYQAHDYAWAMTLLQKSNQDRPNRPTTLYYLSLCYFLNLGDMERAEAAVRQSLELSPNSPEAPAAKQLLFFITACRNSEKLEGAEPQITSTLKQDPANSPALFAKGLLQEKRGNYAEAKTAFESVLARHSDAILAARHLGFLYAERFNEDKKAIELLSKVRETFTRDAQVARALGILACRKGDFEWSAQLLKEASAQIEPDPTLLFSLGIAQYQLKQIPESKQTLSRALAANDQHALASQAKGILASISEKKK